MRLRTFKVLYFYAYWAFNISRKSSTLWAAMYVLEIKTNQLEDFVVNAEDNIIMHVESILWKIFVHFVGQKESINCSNNWHVKIRV